MKTIQFIKKEKHMFMKNCIGSIMIFLLIVIVGVTEPIKTQICYAAQLCDGNQTNQEQLGKIVLGYNYRGISFRYLCEYSYSIKQLEEMDLPTYHTGIDYPASKDTVVRAAVSGMLHKGATFNSGYSLILVPDPDIDIDIDAKPIKIIYLHLNDPDDKSKKYYKQLNKHVNKDDEIGTVYNDHVHIEVRKKYSGLSAVGRNRSCVGGCDTKNESASLTIDPGRLVNSGAISNTSPIAEAAVSKTSGAPYYGYNTPLTVTKGQPVSLYFFADKDVNKDNLASLDPNGWTDSENGVSSGGKVEWNTDLIKGTSPKYKIIKNSPSSPGAANIGPYTYTFNDAPGTYEYQVLKVTDRKGLSGVSKIKITVVTAPVSTNNPPVAEAAVSTSTGGPYYGYSNPLTVTKGKPVSLYFFADKDVNKDNLASLDPNGWTDPDNGVSSGGKVEWNTDLIKGTTPAYKIVKNNPSSAGAANIGSYTYTFNDAPGTYEYQILKITDKKGQSGVSKIRITVVASPAANNPPVAEAAISTSTGGPYFGYSNPLTVTKGKSVSLYFFADKDVNGDGKASLDSDGWTNSDNGISSGGKVEWNTDLIKGTTPAFKIVKNNPSSAGAANIGPYPYTFNDAPGTYEYQVLKITDKKGQSGVSRIRITVVVPSVVVPVPTPSCPSGNGLYCGNSAKGQNTGSLYQCINGSYSLNTNCTEGCQQNGAGKNDSCKASKSIPPIVIVPVPTPSCPSGNGLYCGDSGKGQNSGSLYQCTNGSYSLNKTCNAGCQKNSAGKNDECKAEPKQESKSTKCPSGNGDYCGKSSLGQDTKYLYHCKDGKYSKDKKCSKGCKTNSAGKNDVCK